jgi:hypothetical protein
VSELHKDSFKFSASISGKYIQVATFRTENMWNFCSKKKKGGGTLKRM